MSEPEGPSQFDQDVYTFLAELMLRPRALDALPLTEPSSSTSADESVPPISTHAVVLPLRTGADWERLHERFAKGRRDNLRPWYRCIGLLKGLGARTVVVETYYVCLDYKSEHASFYAHLDAPRHGWTVRLHFFAGEFGDELVDDLPKALKDTYLGYIVCREGDLPLVGRCLLALPSYLTNKKFLPETTAIEELVNFYGQRLHVKGVPFMQQDQRFAMCAHVAVWTLNYSAFRRGVVERRLIADVVESSGEIHPLRPRTSDGLNERQVATLLGELGFRTTTYVSPTPTSDVAVLPRITVGELPQEFVKFLTDETAVDTKDPREDATAAIVKSLIDYVGDATAKALGAKAGKDKESTKDAVIDQDHPTIRALHRLLDYVVTPYLRSGWPVYCGTAEHALVLCGRATIDGRVVHFVHDDQSGPYLLTDSLPTASRKSLQFQSGMPTKMGKTTQERVPPKDRILTALRAGDLNRLRATDMDHSVHSLVVTVPARVLLPAGAANRHTRVEAAILQGRSQAEDVVGLAEDERRWLAEPVRTAVTIMTGVDYKRLRRSEARRRGDRAGVSAYSAVQLAEWVVVVEGLACEEAENKDLAIWEFAYDASSSESGPRLQVARFLRTMVTTFPRDQAKPEATSLQVRAFEPLVVPARIAKVADVDDPVTP